ncbi:MAG TPA: DUF1259 domain-containing protein [Candidatus Polarisedimenticolia bacterium]|nr:DUF1259 domain-containing protein [Candidatus Polarisedimenticolia bacterium]
MTRSRLRLLSVLLASVPLALPSVVAVLAASPPPARPVRTADIDAALGAQGTWNDAEQVYKVSFPRADVPVAVDGFTLPPFLGLTSWVAFKSAGGRKAMMMGDLVLFQDEVNPAIDALLAHGAEVTALHNHFFYDEPRVFFMHVGGTGTERDLAGAARAALDAARQARQARSAPPAALGHAPPPKSDLDGAALAGILGTQGTSKDGMFKAVFGRKVTHGPVQASADMGVNTWAAFAGSPGDAVVDGDFAMREGELQGVLRALRQGGIDIVAIHQHMTHEEPRLIFLHYWGRGAAKGLAQTVKKGLEQLAP